jgi:hypothetical protein
MARHAPPVSAGRRGVRLVGDGLLLEHLQRQLLGLRHDVRLEQATEHPLVDLCDGTRGRRRIPRRHLGRDALGRRVGRELLHVDGAVQSSEVFGVAAVVVDDLVLRDARDPRPQARDGMGQRPRLDGARAPLLDDGGSDIAAIANDITPYTFGSIDSRKSRKEQLRRGTFASEPVPIRRERRSLTRQSRRSRVLLTWALGARRRLGHDRG